MGARRRARHRRVLAAAVLAGATAAGAAACEPGGEGGPSSFAVALTTDRAGTRALERAGFDVSWLTCTSTVGGGARGSALPSVRPSPATASGVASVACEGQTKDGEEIRVAGRVTEERDGRCVRGDLAAEVGGRTVFRVSVLGDCGARPTTRPPTWSPPPEPTVRPTRTVTATATRPAPAPSPDPPAPRPTVTVTVTVGPAPAPDPAPTCGCPPGK
ncbi:hypothetical protein ACIP93_09245 [Streptomyces sp. NPDC088745]|uniref:hypothetical protein n=1 Tax=Streptomyces sp. NPDC088745 TaxID=3365884 RepID=UPI00382B88EF